MSIHKKIITFLKSHSIWINIAVACAGFVTTAAIGYKFLEKPPGGWPEAFLWAGHTVFTPGTNEIGHSWAAKLFILVIVTVTFPWLLRIGAEIVPLFMEKIRRKMAGLAKVTARRVVLLVTMIDEKHAQAMAEALRDEGVRETIVFVASEDQEFLITRPELPLSCGNYEFVRGPVGDPATYTRAGSERCDVAVVGVLSLNDLTSDRQIATPAKTLKNLGNGQIFTVAEYLDSDRHVRHQAWSVDESCSMDDLICEALAQKVLELAKKRDRQITVRFRAYDRAKDATFVKWLRELGVNFQRIAYQSDLDEDNLKVLENTEDLVKVEESVLADIEVLFASDLDNPTESDNIAQVLVDDMLDREGSDETDVVVEYLSVNHKDLFNNDPRIHAFCLDSTVTKPIAKIVADELRRRTAARRAKQWWRPDWTYDLF